MIIVKLKGGLGNQMFQYAAGRALAVANNDILKFDLSYFSNPPAGDVPRKYELYNFRVVAEEATDDDIRRIVRSPFKQALGKIKSRLGMSQSGYFSDPKMRYLPDFRHLRGDVYLDGYWQSARYFEKIENEIRDELRPVFSGSKHTAELLERITTTNSVCINVRRADFLNNDFHGCMGTDYFGEAQSVLAKSIVKSRKFVFSDDIAWCQEHFGNEPDTTVVGHEYAGRDYMDYLFLMSSCKHFIIPNSSFAWWAAWLSSNPSKQVIAPARWFNDPSVDTSDIIPQEWLRI